MLNDFFILFSIYHQFFEKSYLISNFPPKLLVIMMYLNNFKEILQSQHCKSKTAIAICATDELIYNVVTNHKISLEVEILQS